MLVEGIHFDLGFTPLKHLGYKAVVVNLSDVCAMNLKPTQLTVSVAVSNRFTLEAMEALYEGISLASGIYEVDVVGGDTVSSNKGLIISVTAIGMGAPEEVVYRSGAKPNDLLVVSGDLGAAYMGLQVLRREQEVFKVNPDHQPDLEPYQYLVERQLKPEARKDIVELLKALEVRPTAMIDISDGLSSEILHLCQSSGVGCNLFEEKIPLDPMVISSCEEFGLDSSLAALSGGEDYELLFTVSQEDYPKIKANPNLTVIGHMTTKEEGAHMIGRGGNRIPITAQGWNAFGEKG
jgi:thiamine-monophosphate kinase